MKVGLLETCRRVGICQERKAWGITAPQEESEVGVGDKTVSAVGVAPNTPHPQARTSWPLEALGSALCRELLGPTRGPQGGGVRVRCVA